MLLISLVNVLQIYSRLLSVGTIDKRAQIDEPSVKSNRESVLELSSDFGIVHLNDLPSSRQLV